MHNKVYTRFAAMSLDITSIMVRKQVGRQFINNKVQLFNRNRRYGPDLANALALNRGWPGEFNWQDGKAIRQFLIGGTGKRQETTAMQVYSGK